MRNRAGVNAFIRGVDRLAEKRLPAVVVLCTNRLSAIDPAVQRRAAEIFEFRRPDEAQRRTVIEAPLAEAGLAPLRNRKVGSDDRTDVRYRSRFHLFGPDAAIATYTRA